MGKLAAIAALLAFEERHDSNLLRLDTIAADTETIVIGTDTFTCVAADPEDNEFVPGANAAASITNIAACINTYNTQDLTAVAVAGGVLVYSNVSGARGLACTESLDGTDNVWAAAAMYGGSTTSLDDSLRPSDLVAVTPNATEVAVGLLDRIFAFEVAAVIVDVRDSGGAAVAWDGDVAIDGQRVTIDNGGSTDWAADSTVTILAAGA